MSKQIKLRADKQGNKNPSKQANKQTNKEQPNKKDKRILFVCLNSSVCSQPPNLCEFNTFFFLCMFWVGLLICSLSGVTREHFVVQAVSQFAAPGSGEKGVQVEIVVRVMVILCGADV